MSPRVPPFWFRGLLWSWCLPRRSLREQPEKVRYGGQHAGDHRGQQEAQEQERQDHRPQPPAAQLHWVGQEAAVDHDEQGIVEDHHDRAKRSRDDQQRRGRGDEAGDDDRAEDNHGPEDHEVEPAHREGLALLHVVGLQGVADEPGDPVEDPQVGREQDDGAGYKEEGPKPRRHLLRERLALLLDELELLELSTRVDAYGGERQRTEHHGHEEAEHEESDEVLGVGDLPPGPEAVEVLLCGARHVAGTGGGLLLACDRGDDVGDEGPHPHLLVPHPVGLHQVVGPACPGESYGSCHRSRADHPHCRRDVLADLHRGAACQSAPGPYVGGDDHGHHDEADNHHDHRHLDLLYRLVDHRRDTKRYADGDQYDDRDRYDGAATEAGPESYRCGGAGCPPGPHVGQDRADDEEDAPVPPEPGKAGNGSLASHQGVALDLHVHDVLEEERQYGRPEYCEAHLRDDQGPYYELTRTHRRSGNDRAGADDLPYRHRIRQVAVRDPWKPLARKLCGECASSTTRMMCSIVSHASSSSR